MLVRILRPALRQSEHWNRCTFFEQSFYIRLITIVDDDGRYDANPILLASECFPYGDEVGLRVMPLKVDGMLRSLASKELILLHEHDGKQLLQIARWKEWVQSKIRTPRKSVQFVPPTLEMVKLHGAKIGLTVHECEKFHAHYEANGWRVGRVAMKSWPAAMIYWRKCWQERPITDKSVAVAQVAAAAGTSRTLKTLDKLIEQP